MEKKPCQNCGVMPGENHRDACDLEQCSECGKPTTYCECDLQVEKEILPWDGDYPGATDAGNLGFWCHLTNHGWARCDKDHPDAMPDINRLCVDAVWDKQKKKFVKRK